MEQAQVPRYRPAAVALTAALSVFAASTASADDCRRLRTPGSALRAEASYVVLVQVVGETERQCSRARLIHPYGGLEETVSSPVTTHEAKVLGSWRGETEPTVLFVAAGSRITIELGDCYVLFADPKQRNELDWCGVVLENGLLETEYCDRTAHVEEATEVLRALGPPDTWLIAPDQLLQYCPEFPFAEVSWAPKQSRRSSPGSPGARGVDRNRGASAVAGLYGARAGPSHHP